MENLETRLSEANKDLEAVVRTIMIIRGATFSGAGSENVYRTLELLKSVAERITMEIENEKDQNTSEE